MQERGPRGLTEIEAALSEIEARIRGDDSRPQDDAVQVVISELSEQFGIARTSGNREARSAIDRMEIEDVEPDLDGGTDPVSEDWAVAVQALPVLTPERQVICAWEIEAGVLAAATLDGLIPRRTSASDSELRELVCRGQAATAEMVQGNLRLVLYWARRYARGDPGLFEDLFQDGYFGLYRAIQGWDALRGYRFSTYATWQIRQSLQRGLQLRYSTAPVHLPVHVLEELAGAEEARGPLTANAQLALNWLQRRVSWERLAEELPEFTDGPDPDFEGSTVSRLALESSVRQVLAFLDERDALVLSMRAGLEGDPATLEAIGKELHVSRERVRQIEVKVLRSLRLHALSQSSSLQARVTARLRADPSAEAAQAVRAIGAGLLSIAAITSGMELPRAMAQRVAEKLSSAVLDCALDPSDLPRIWLDPAWTRRGAPSGGPMSSKAVARS